MSIEASARDVSEVVGIIRQNSPDPCNVDISTLDGRVNITISCSGPGPDSDVLRSCKAVETVESSAPSHRLASGIPSGGNGELPGRIRIEVPYAGVAIGGNEFVVIAGPCSVENENCLFDIAHEVKSRGVRLLRGGAYKPRTSPYSFQGLGVEGLKILGKVREETGIGIVTEAMEPATLPLVSEVADIIQIGSRNMQNFPLLKAAGRQEKPVLLKRGMSATVDEWLGAAEYIMSEGNPNVILCERGIRTFSAHSRHTLDIGVIPAIRELSSLPVIIDPSHATGSAKRVPSMARASLAAGADGLLIEIHPDPSKAFSDGFQALNFEEFKKLMEDLGKISANVGRELTVWA